MTDRRNANQLCTSIIKPRQISSRSLSHGIKYEKVACEAFEDFTTLKTASCGIFVNESKPMLAATPDRVVSDGGILEVKCPFSAWGKPISPTTVPYLTLSADEPVLKSSHEYYYQIQGQLFCTNKDYCYFVVYTGKEPLINQVFRDEEFIASMVNKLERFYQEHFKQALIEKLLYKDYFTYTFK